MADNLTEAGTELFNTEEKLFEDIQAEPGQSAYTFMHTVPRSGAEFGFVTSASSRQFVTQQPPEPGVMVCVQRISRQKFRSHSLRYSAATSDCVPT